MRLLRFIMLVSAWAGLGYASDQAWLRDPTRNNYCWVRGAAGNPATIVCDSSTPHGLSVGDVVIIYDVLGNDIVNGIRKVTATGTTTGGSCPAGTCTVFSIADINNNPINSSGTFVAPTSYAGGLAPGNWGGASPGKLYTLTDHPRVWFDGPSGPLTASLSDKNGRANPSGIQYQALTNAYNAYGVNAQSATVISGDTGLLAALKWQADGQPAGAEQTNAAWFATHLPLMWGPGAGPMTCNEAVGNCGIGQFLNSFGVNALADLTLIYELVYPTLTTAQRTAWVDFNLNDNSESHAGLGTHGSLTTGCTKPPTSGSFTWADDSNNDCGNLWMFKHASDYPFADPAWYPTQGSSGIGLDNLNLSALHTFFMVGLSTCGSDVAGDPVADRGCRLAAMSSALLWDHFIALSTGSWGRGYSNYIYNRDSVHWNYGIVLAILKNSIVGYYQLGNNLAADMTLEPIYNSIPYRVGQSVHYGGDPGNLDMSQDYGFNGLISPAYLSGSSAGYGLYFLYNFPNGSWSAGCMGSSCGLGALTTGYVFIDPNIPTVNWNTLPTQRIFHPRSSADCQPTGHVNCGLYDIAIQQVSSRTGWGTSDTSLTAFSWWQSYDGHSDTTGSCPGCIRLHKNQGLLSGNFANMAGGDAADDNTMPLDNVIYVGGTIRNFVEFGCHQFGSPHISRWAGADPTGDTLNRYTYGMIDLSGAYCAGIGLTRLNKHIVHLKSGGQDYVVVYVDGASSTPITFQEYVHYRLMQDCSAGPTGLCTGVGGNPPAYSPGITVNRAAGTVSLSDNTTNAHIDTRFMNVAGSSTMYVGDQKNSDSDCSFTGTSGASCRIEVGSSANGTSVAPVSTAEWIYIHRPSTSTSATMPALSQPACAGTGANCTVIQAADPSAPKVAAFARQGGFLTGAGFTTNHSGTAQYLVAGMAPGNYNVAVNNTSVLVGAAVRSGDNSLYFESTAGTVSITVQSAPTIITASLPASTAGIAYSQSLSAIGGAPPYVWSVSSGSLPHNLTLNANTGVIGGTPDTAATSTFTVTVTDSATASNSKTLSITINPVVAVSTSTLPGGAPFQAYSQTLSATGGTGAYTWSIAAGALPAGLQLNANTGIISGTPTPLGIFNFTASATDAVGAVASRPLSISVQKQPGTTARGVTLRRVMAH